jgi:hypothetical protein
MNRKYRTLTIGLFLTLSATCLPATVRAQTKDPLLAIRQQYAAINKRAAKYRKVKKELSGYSLEGGELMAYFDGPAIVKIVARHFGESGNTVEEYYYRNGQLMFVFEKVSRYSRPLSGKVVSAVENRFYFQDDDLIRWLREKGKEVPVSEEYRLKEKVLLENSGQFVSGARSTKALIEAP